MSGAITIRRGGEVDAAALRAIRLEALADTPEAFGSTYDETVAWDDAAWRDVAGRWTFFLAEDEERPVGMVTGGRHDNYPGTWWLFGMYVVPALRGAGVAERLVARVGDWARDEGASELHLHVTELVPRARAFYEKVGFRATGEVASLHRDAAVGLVTLVLGLG
ncbi:MAG: GNAT family N-acetyltransferase [Acidimicrobiales bacterium]